MPKYVSSSKRDTAEAHEVEAAERARREKEAEAAALVQAELERRARLDGQLAEAARHLARENLTKAIVITESVLRAEPDNAAARDLLARAQGAIEAKRLAEEQAAQAREKRHRLEDMIATAEAAGTPDSAIEILETALLETPATRESSDCSRGAGSRSRRRATRKHQRPS